MLNQQEIIELPEVTKIVSVIGADTFWGKHLVRHLSARDKVILGFFQTTEFAFNAVPDFIDGAEKVPYCPAPIISDYIIICLDPNVGFLEYVKKIEHFCNQCITEDFIGKIGYISRGDICIPRYNEPIEEDSVVAPRTQSDLALATSENILNLLLYSDTCYALPVIMRVGVPYGNEFDKEAGIGMVHSFIKRAAYGKSVKFPFPGVGKRSLTHISDICEAVIQILDTAIAPMKINIPGENFTIEEVANMIAKRYNVKSEKIGLASNNDQYFFPGDQHLSDKLFAEEVEFARAHSFAKWLEK